MREVIITQTLASSLDSVPPGVDVVEKFEPVVVQTKEDELAAVAIAEKDGRIFVKCPDWKVIPLENLISKCNGKAKVVAVVETAEEARIALEALELGVDGVLLDSDDASQLASTMQLLRELDGGMIKLEEAKITSVKRLGMGSRSCIDTCSMMGPGEGMLIGNSASGMLLVQSECEENSLAAPRPFRVNAGAVSLYTLAPGNRTRYIEELKAGDEVLTLRKNGATKKAFVARSKIELRPLIMVEAEGSNREVVKAILQDAETVRLVTPNGHGSIPVSSLKPGDKILAHFEVGAGGRHFGTQVRGEQIVEK